MLLNQQTLDAASIGFRTEFNRAMSDFEPTWSAIAMLVPSTTKQNTYVWLGDLPGLREWIGERQVRALAASDYSIKNKKFESTVGVDEDDFEDDNLGVHMPRFRMMGASAIQHPDQLVWGLLNNGFSSVGFDGKSFFATDHPIGDAGSTYSNKSVLPLDASNYKKVRGLMMRLKDSEGRPLGLVPRKLVVPPELEGTARDILFAEQIAGTTNTYRNSAELVVNPNLTSATAWYLMAEKWGLKALIYQERRKPRLIAMNRLTDTNVFFEGKALFGVDYRGNVGYGLPFLCYGSTGTG